MIPLITQLIDAAPLSATTPAMKRVRDLAHLDGVRFEQREGYSQPAEHMRALWSARLWNMRRKRRRFVGLPALVRSLAALPREERVQQMSLRHGLSTALVFFRAKDRELVGAVVTVRTAADVKRSWDNYRMANGEWRDRRAGAQAGDEQPA